MHKHTKIAAGGACFCIALFLVILLSALLASSHIELSANSYGIRYGGYNMKIYPEVETANRKHWLSPGDTFISFPSTPFTITHTALECYTSDRVELDVDLSFQVVLSRDNLIEMLFVFGEFPALERLLTSFTRVSIRNVCAQHSYEEFYGQRGAIEAAMRARVAADMLEFAPSSNGISSLAVNALQLVNVALPESLGIAIGLKEDALAQIINVQNLREQVVIAATTQLRSAEEAKLRSLIEAEADALGEAIRAEQNAELIRLQAEQAAAAELAKLTERAEAFANIAAGLGVQGVEALPALRYLVNSG